MVDGLEMMRGFDVPIQKSVDHSPSEAWSFVSFLLSAALCNAFLRLVVPF
jgi:hypothetical protein